VLEIHREVTLTTNSFPAFSGLLANLTAADAAAPEEIPTYKKWISSTAKACHMGDT